MNCQETLLGNDISGSIFCASMRYRYALWRTWTDNGLTGDLCAFIGLNPSTATHEVDDPTIRRCIRFCKDWGYDGYVMLNLFAYRATDPSEMKRQASPVGMANDEHIAAWSLKCRRVVCAWGNDGAHMEQALQITRLLNGVPLHHLGLTKQGQPKHPLYLKADTKPILWER